MNGILGSKRAKDEKVRCGWDCGESIEWIMDNNNLHTRIEPKQVEGKERGHCSLIVIPRKASRCCVDVSDAIIMKDKATRADVEVTEDDVADAVN